MIVTTANNNVEDWDCLLLKIIPGTAGHSIGSWNVSDNGRRDYTDVNVALFNELARTRGILRDSFRNIGFRPANTHVLALPDKLIFSISRGDIDFLVLEADERPVEMCELVRDIRLGKIGPNPYLVISVITWRADNLLITNFINAGADDVIVMPASVGFASGRVDQLIDDRREFVVTTGYVGPDRRSRSRITIDELGTFAVPNGLRYKTTGDESAKPNSAGLKRANRTVKEHRLRRLTLRLEQLAAEGERFATEQPGAPLPTVPLTELLDLTEDIEKRSHGASTSVTELTASMGSIMQAIVRESSASADMFALLKVHGQALLSLQRGDEDATELVVRAVKTAKQVVEKRSQAAS
jgi:hypothetical protein